MARHALEQQQEVPRRRKRRRWGSPEEWGSGLIMVAPVVLLFATFSVYPLARTVMLSFTDWSGLSSTFNWIGFENYGAVFGDGVWWQSLGHSVILAVLALTIMNGISLGLAIALDRPLRGQMVYRTIFYLPPILSGIVVAIIWKWFYQPDGGPLNRIIELLGGEGHAWLADDRTALLAISVASMWQGVGMPFLLFLAALHAIPTELYEAMAVDGARGWRVFWHLTLPMLRPILGVVSVMTFLGAFELFSLVLAMTGGGPGYATEVPILHIFRAAFDNTRFGYASALSVVFGILMLIMAGIGLRITRRGKDE